MRRLQSILIYFAASILATTANAEHREGEVAISSDIINVVRSAQHRETDLLAESLDKHLLETSELARRVERNGAEIGQNKNREFRPSDIASRRSEAAAKRRQLDEIKGQFLERLDAVIHISESSGDENAAAQARGVKRKLGQRFASIRSDLEALERADSGNIRARAERVNQRLQGWLSARPHEVLPEPNWTIADPQPEVDLPRAEQPPRFVFDAFKELNHVYGTGQFNAKVALRSTPESASACDYSVADLSPTSEAPSNHPEIIALAEKLSYDPIKIFEWVNQNIQYEPYFGSMKGGLSTLRGKSGGATDHSSLLIALLRASNIPARYVRGTIAVMDKEAIGAEGRGPRWIGAKSYAAAAVILSKNSNPSAGTILNKGVKLAHVWVQACVPYASYRGAALDDSGHRWIPLDPSYKDHIYQSGIALDSTFDFDYAGWLSSRFDAAGRYRLPHEKFSDEAVAHARTKTPLLNVSLADIPYKGEMRKIHYDILPIVPPYEVLSYDSWSGIPGDSSETAELPDRHRYRLELTIRNSSTASGSENYNGNILSRKTINLSEIATKRLTLAFHGATPTANDLFENWIKNSVNPSLPPVCATTIDMVPVLRIDGIEISKDIGSGTTPLCPGASNNYAVLQMKVTVSELPLSGGLINSVNFSSINSSNLHALHAYAWHTSDAYLAERSEKLLAAVNTYGSDINSSAFSRDESEGEFLNIAASRFSRYIADSSRQIGGLFGETGFMGVGLGLTSGQIKTTYVFDLPYGLFRRGFLIDWPSAKYTGSRLDAASTTDSRAFKLSAFAASAYEAYIWQDVANLDAISTTRGIQFAYESDIEVLHINNSTEWAASKCKLDNTCENSTFNTNPAGTNYTAARISEIGNRYIRSGFKILIPRHQISYPSTGPGSWVGTTLYAEKLTGSSWTLGFPIVSYSGGVTIEPSGNGGLSGGASGGYAGNSPASSVYVDPSSTPGSVGSGIAPEATAPVAAQQNGINSLQTADGSCATSTCSGDPVNMITGNLVHSERDIAIRGRGGLPLVFERWYNSRGAKDGPLGFGWTHSFNHLLKFYGVEGSVVKLSWVDGTGGERFFSTPDHTNGIIAAGASIKPPDGIYAKAERLANGEYRISERSGMKYIFESIDTTATDTGQKARLLSITDRNKNTISLSYCGGNLCFVKDSLNRTLSLSYVNGRIQSITDWSGRIWEYEYDSNGDLTVFKNPLSTGAFQAPVRYHYYTSADGERISHAMRRYILPRGNGMGFEYYANGRVFRHTPFGTDGQAREDHATTFVWTEFRRETRQIDALGHERAFQFDPYGNPLSITDEAGARHDYTYYQEPGRTHLRKTSTAPNGLTTQYAYDPEGNLTDITLPSGRSIRYRDHTTFGKPQRTSDAEGYWTLLRYDSVTGNLTDELRMRAGVVPAAGIRPGNTDVLAWSQFQFDIYGNPIKTRRLRDWNAATLGDASSGGVGPSIEYAYDPSSLNVTELTRRGDTDGTPATLETDSYTAFSYDSLGRMTRGPDASWYAADFGYDTLDRPVRTPDGRGNTWSMAYDENGNPLHTGLTVGSAYLDGYYAVWDDMDRQERRVDYAGNAVLNTYNPLGHLTQVTGPDGYAVSFDLDPLGRVTSAYNEEGLRVSIDLDSDGQPRRVIDPNNLQTNYLYFGASNDGRLKTITLPKITGQTAGRATEVAAYDGAGHPTRINAVAADGTVRDTYRFFDELGRLTKELGPQVNPPGDITRPLTCYVYTPLSDLKEVWAGLGSESDAGSSVCVLDGILVRKQSSATYDDFGRKLSETDPNGKTSTWVWNTHNQLVSSRTPQQAAAGQSTTYTYGTKGTGGETQGALKSWSAPGALNVSLSRNALGQVTRSETRDASNGLVVAYDYAYDTARRLVRVTDSRGTSATTKSIYYGWTPGGRLTHLEDGDGHRTSFSYDATGRLASVSAPNGEQISYVWDAGGRLVERRLDSGLITLQTWFEDGSLKSRSNKIGATSLSSHTYTLDAFGRRATQSEEIGNTKSWTYSYDRLDRLTSASNGVLESYTYDIWGNRRSKTTTAGTTAYLYDAAHQLSEIRGTSDTGILTGAAVHDANGQLTKLCEVGSGGVVTKTASDCTASGTGASALTLVWNALGHLGAATRTGTGAVSETYGYDSSGRRLDKTSAGLTRHYLYDGDDIHAEWAATLSGAPAAVHVHGAGADEPLLRLSGATTSASAAQLAFVQDGLGSVVGVVSPTSTSLATNQRFDAWGNRSAGTGTIPLYGYTGREPDATGLTYYRARYYHPGIGRFVSRDPAGMADAFSAYAYVRNNPISLIDPFGWLALPPDVMQALNSQGSSYTGTSMSDIAGTACGVGSQCAFAGALAGSQMTTAAATASTVGNQSLHGGRGAGTSSDPLAPVRDSTSSGSSSRVSGQIGGFTSEQIQNLPLTTPINIILKAADYILNQGAEGGKPPELPTGLTGGNPRQGSGSRINTDLPGDSRGVFDSLSGGKSTTQDDGTKVAPNGVRLRPGKDDRGPRIDIPASGSRPHETIHFPPGD